MFDNQNILGEADKLVNGDRQEAYGDAVKSLDRIAKLWSAILGKDIEGQEVGLCLVALKISRECGKHKMDNLIDGAGYFALIEKYYKGKESN